MGVALYLNIQDVPVIVVHVVHNPQKGGRAVLASAKQYREAVLIQDSRDLLAHHPIFHRPSAEAVRLGVGLRDSEWGRG